ncbi:MAG TPA: hypothetical protein VLA84_24310 [Microcoleus sp.]|nr:hypothetical protein [Microcoleus sp.]
MVTVPTAIEHNLKLDVGYSLSQKLKMPVCISTTAEAGNNNPLMRM